MKRNKVSIITVSLNSEAHLEQSLCSVIEQEYSHIEHIVIDGGSTDGTIGIINKYAEHLAYWISEPDKGIADAMNKGVAQSSGDYLLFLQTDDYLVSPTVIDKVMREISRQDDIVLCDIIFKLGNETEVLAHPRGLGWWTNFKTGVFHQSALIHRQFFNRIGNFDINYKVAMDYDFFLRAYRHEATCKYIAMPLSVMRHGGISSKSDWCNLKLRFNEERQIHIKNCDSVLKSCVYKVYWMFYIPYRRCRQVAGNIRQFFVRKGCSSEKGGVHRGQFS